MMTDFQFDIGESSEAAPPDAFVLCTPKGWDSYISREFHEIQQNLASLGWTMMVVDETDDERLLDVIRRARLVLLWECYEILERLADSFATLPKHIRRHWADLILATYPNKLIEWFPDVKKRIKWTPHSAASAFSPFFAPVFDRVLLSGSRTWPYPFRQFCAAKLPDAVCNIVDHPGYPGYPGDRTNQMRADSNALATVGGPRYATLLRRHPAMLVCGSIFNYLVAKVFEGMATGCLVIADRESLGAQLAALGFVEREDYIGTDIFHVIEDAAEVQRLFLNDVRRWSAIVERASLKVAKHHTTNVRARNIHALCLQEVAT
ncbi:glycosyl transferase family 1 [Trinickia symbiotica]|nr:glycosyltransferase [Trinickia symbiotica]PPK44025.1 glycosyl transferase family 1 [Trinickia symbiotica]